MGATVAIGLLLVLAALAPIIPVFGQTAQQVPEKSFESATSGIKFNYPADWVVDTSLADSTVADLTEAELGVMILATICPQEDALPAIGGKSSCEDSNNGVYVLRYKNLETQSEFSVLENPTNITLDDFVAYSIDQLRDIGYTGRNEDFKIIEQTDTKVNITTTSSGINQTEQLPARLVELTYRPGYSIYDIRSFELVTLNGTTAYTVNYEDAADLNPAGRIPPPAKVIFDSFELVPASGKATSSNPPTGLDRGNSAAASGEDTEFIANLTKGVEEFFADG